MEIISIIANPLVRTKNAGLVPNRNLRSCALHLRDLRSSGLTVMSCAGWPSSGKYILLWSTQSRLIACDTESLLWTSTGDD